MRLTEAFSVLMKNKEIISFVGGGGKTSAIFRLARELKHQERKVLVTTTTKMYVPEASFYEYLFIGNEISEEKLNSIRSRSITVVGLEITPQHKLKGISLETVDILAERGIFDVILVEADGSKSRPIKAPDAHEPVIPQNTSILTGVIGFDCYGKPLDCEWAYQPQILAGLTGKLPGDVIDADVIQKLITAPNGLFKNCPVHAREIVLFNKVLSPENLDEAERIGNFILDGAEKLDAVIIGAVLEEPPVHCLLKR